MSRDERARRTPIDASRVASWTEHIRGPDLETLEAQTAALASFFGYSFTDAAVLEALVPGRRVVTGSELAERRARFGDVPELYQPPIVPAVERPLDRNKVVLRRRDRAAQIKAGPSGERERARRAVAGRTATPAGARRAARSPIARQRL